MEQHVIEHRTVLPLEHGELTRYETNVPCSDLSFHFQRPMITMMLSGEKQIAWQHGHLSFRTDTVFIPPHSERMKVNIGRASTQAPARCVVLDVEDAFVDMLYQEIVERWNPEWINMKITPRALQDTYITGEQEICGTYRSLYQHASGNSGQRDLSFLLDLKLKELLFSLLKKKSQSVTLLGGEVADSGPVAAVINYIHTHFREQIDMKKMARMACMSNASFFKKFRDLLGCSPATYLINRRLEHAKMLLATTLAPIGDIVLDAGFQSFEYFCRKFKAEEGLTPMAYRMQCLQQAAGTA